MLSVFLASLYSVLKVFAVCLVGAWLAWRGVLTAPHRRALSQAILLAMLPALLVEKLSRGANLESLAKLALLPAAALVYIVLGFCVGLAVARVMRVPAELRRITVAATAFGNSGYVPLPLVAAIAATAPIFAADPEAAADSGILYVSLYLLAMSPCLWGLGFPYLSGRPLRELNWRHILSAPVLAAAAGLAIGLAPPLRGLFLDPGAPLGLVMSAAGLLGTGAIPCALLVLGANVVDSARERSGNLSAATVAAVCTGRLVLMPVMATGLVLALRALGRLPDDPMFTLVLLLESAVPSATNLIVMCQVHERGENAMANLLFWVYLLAVPTLTAAVALFLWIVGNP